MALQTSMHVQSKYGLNLGFTCKVEDHLHNVTHSIHRIDFITIDVVIRLNKFASILSINASNILVYLGSNDKEPLLTPTSSAKRAVVIRSIPRSECSIWVSTSQHLFPTFFYRYVFDFGGLISAAISSTSTRDNCSTIVYFYPE